MKKPKQKQKLKGKDEHRNRPINIPLTFDAAVEGLLKVKPKKKPSGEQPPK